MVGNGRVSVICAQIPRHEWKWFEDVGSMAKAIRVIQTTGGLDARYGGPSGSITTLCDALAAVGVQVDLVSAVNKRVDGEPILPTSANVRTWIEPAWQAGRLRYYPSYADRMRTLLGSGQRSEAIVVHDNGLWGHFNRCAWQVARSFRLPYLLSPRGMIEPWTLHTKRLRKSVAMALYQRKILETVTLFVATAEPEYRSIRSAGFRNPVAIVPNGIALRDRGVLSERPTSKDERVILFLSRVHPKKGLLSLVDAWAEVDRRGWKLLIAGPDEEGHLAAVLGRVRLRGVADSVTYIGAVADEAKSALYQRADLFVLPTFSENFGLVVAEALAHGVPVITTKGAPWRDLETHGCGWWIDIGVGPLAAALREAMSKTDEERRAMGDAGRVYVRRYEWTKIGQQMRETYEWILGHRERPDWVSLD